MEFHRWIERATAVVLATMLACTAADDDEENADTDPSPSMLDACREACAEFTEADCNPAQELSVCEATCEQSDAELVGAFTECVDDDACGDCAQVWCVNGCA